jgi:DedD protein
VATALQNRLVGTIILVAIAVIFLPDLLDGKKQSNKDLFVELPQKPTMKLVKSPESLDTDGVRQAATRKIEIIDEKAVDDILAEPNDTAPTASLTSEPANVQVATDSSTDSPETGSLEQETVVEDNQQSLLESAGWVVQLGSFSHQKNVRELLTKLEKGGYRAFSRPVQTSAGELTKVFVGPDLQKEKLEGAISHLKQLTNLQGRVTPFTVQ